MSRAITVRLSTRSIENAIKRLEEYKSKATKFETTLEALIAGRLVEIAQSNFESAIIYKNFYETVKPSVSVSKRPDGTHTVVIASSIGGNDAMWVEFGTGVYYNGTAGGSPHPKGVETGMTIGSYGQGKGKQRTWGYYDENGDLQRTHGTPAQMPMYNAANTIRKEIPKLARKAFRASL